MNQDKPATAKPDSEPFFIVVMAASMGGIPAISRILSELPDPFPAAVAIVQHRAPVRSKLAEVMSYRSGRTVRDARDGDQLTPGSIFLAPAGYHLLVNADSTFQLSDSPKVHFSRPAADWLLTTGAIHFGNRLIAVILTGYDSDGSTGSKYVKLQRGQVIAQDETTAEVFDMPKAAIAAGCVDWVLPLHDIAAALKFLVSRGVR